MESEEDIQTVVGGGEGTMLRYSILEPLGPHHIGFLLLNLCQCRQEEAPWKVFIPLKRTPVLSKCICYFCSWVRPSTELEWELVCKMGCKHVQEPSSPGSMKAIMGGASISNGPLLFLTLCPLPDSTLLAVKNIWCSMHPFHICMAK